MAQIFNMYLIGMLHNKKLKNEKRYYTNIVDIKVKSQHRHIHLPIWYSISHFFNKKNEKGIKFAY